MLKGVIKKRIPKFALASRIGMACAAPFLK
jgi:hypothetical protein